MTNIIHERMWSFFLLVFNQYLLMVNYVAGGTTDLGNAEMHTTRSHCQGADDLDEESER